MKKIPVNPLRDRHLWLAAYRRLYEQNYKLVFPYDLEIKYLVESGKVASEEDIEKYLLSIAKKYDHEIYE